jgi:cell division protein FtsZ
LTCVVALGGGAGNALNHILASGVLSVATLAANTDAQDLKRSRAESRVLLGREVTRSLGANADPEVGAQATVATADELRPALLGTRLVIVLACLGGGTGSGAAPVVVGLAREGGAVVVPIVTLPFAFEGRRRRRQADEALAALIAANDGVVAMAHGGVWLDPGKRMMTEAFHEMDEAVECAVHGLLARVAAIDGAPELEEAARAWAGTWTPRNTIGTAPEQK